MSKINEALYNIRRIEDFAQKDTLVHRLHPMAKLLTTLVYLFAVVSFGKHEVAALLPMVFYPALILAMAEIPVVPLLKRLLIAEPLIIGIGILNPVLDKHTFLMGGLVLSQGWITFLVIFLKGGLTVVACLLLVSTTSMQELGIALRMLHVPKILVLQLLLTYRYISVLTAELFRMHRAYSLRAPGQRGISHKAWGSFAGQLLLRTFDRAQAVYLSMSLRGFDGEYRTAKKPVIKKGDLLFTCCWALFFAAARAYDLPGMIEILVMGGMR